MADKPILFSAPMVRALLDGRKTQTRRVLKVKLPSTTDMVLWDTDRREWRFHWDDCEGAFKLPILVGDRLYVREHWRCDARLDHLAPRDIKSGHARVQYIATHGGDAFGIEGRFRQGMHMPRWASRLTLTVTDVRVERLQDINDADALAEGVEGSISPVAGRDIDIDGFYWSGGPKRMFQELWNSINGAGAWDANPWVVAYSFTVQRGNIDQVAA